MDVGAGETWQKACPPASVMSSDKQRGTRQRQSGTQGMQ